MAAAVLSARPIPGASIAVPRRLFAGRVERRLLPVAQLGGVSAALSPRETNGAFAAYTALRPATMSLAGSFGRIVGRSDQNEVAVHHGDTFNTGAFGHKLFFRRLIVDKHHVGVTATTNIQCLSGAECHHFYRDATDLAELRQDKEQPRLLGGCRGETTIEASCAAAGTATTLDNASIAVPAIVRIRLQYLRRVGLLSSAYKDFTVILLSDKNVPRQIPGHEKRISGAILDHTSGLDEHNSGRHSPRLRYVVRRHHQGGAVTVQTQQQLLDGAHGCRREVGGGLISE